MAGTAVPSSTSAAVTPTTNLLTLLTALPRFQWPQGLRLVSAPARAD
jgi:hypothetical protein